MPMSCSVSIQLHLYFCPSHSCSLQHATRHRCALDKREQLELNSLQCSSSINISRGRSSSPLLKSVLACTEDYCIGVSNSTAWLRDRSVCSKRAHRIIFHRNLTTHKLMASYVPPRLCSTLVRVDCKRRLGDNRIDLLFEQPYAHINIAMKIIINRHRET